MKALGLPILEIEGDRERSQSSVSASVGEGGQAIVGNSTQGARETAPDKTAKRCLLSPMPSKLPSRLLANRSVRRLPFRRSRKDDGAIIRVIPFRCC